MGKPVIFDKNAGTNFVRGKKRLRGGDPSTKPEIKKYNMLATDTSGFAAMDFVNTAYQYENGVGINNAPVRLNWPIQGTASYNRVGASIILKYIRIKGWVTMSAYNLAQIRWRLKLIRYDFLPGTAGTVDQNAYLSQFENADARNVTGATSTAIMESWARHNFYKKFKNVENQDFRSKVLASGVVPSQNNFHTLSFSLNGTVGSNQTSLTTVAGAYIKDCPNDNYGYLPIDISVTINDRVDCVKDLRQFYLVLESDVPYGWTNYGAISYNKAGILLNLYARAYFTDA